MMSDGNCIGGFTPFGSFCIGSSLAVAGCVAVMTYDYNEFAVEQKAIFGAGDRLGFRTFMDFEVQSIMTDLEDRIWFVETTRGFGPIRGDADELGPLQITEDAWKDAIEFRPEIGGVYADCADLTYSILIFRAYMDRWAFGESNEVKARRWNGGPKGDTKESTKPYWEKCQSVPKKL